MLNCKVTKTSKTGNAKRVSSPEKKKRILHDRIFIYGWLAVPILAWLVFYVYVNVDMVVKSFYNNNYLGEYIWTGLDNYKTVLHYLTSSDTTYGFWNLKTLLNSLTIFPLLLLLSLLNIVVAYYIFRKSKGHNFFRVALFIPALIALSAWAQLFRLALDSQVGIVNTILGMSGLEKIIPANGWFGTAEISWPVVIAFCIWTGVGGANMAYYTSAMNRIPMELFEAARLDGATEWDELRNIVIPLIWPLFCTMSTTSLGSIFTLAQQPLLVTGGGPSGSSSTLGLLIVSQTKDGSNIGLVCCLGTIILVVGGILIKVYHKFISSLVEEVEY